MTSKEIELLGVKNLEEAQSLRDIVMRMAGTLEEHVRTEEQWQERVEKVLSGIPDTIDKKIEQHTEVTFHDPNLQAAIQFAQAHAASSQVLKTQGNFLTKLVVTVGAFFAAIVAALEVADHIFK